MAKPDTDDGWIKLAHELDAALAFADFTKAQRIVLHFAFAQAFGPAKRRLLGLSPADMAKLTGLDRHNLGAAVRSLLADGVLVRHEDGRHTFVKDYESWRRGDAPRFKPSEVAFIKGAPARAMGFRGTPAAESIQTPQAGFNQTPAGSIQTPGRGGFVPPNGVDSYPVWGTPPHTPPLSGGRKENQTSQTGGAGIVDSDSERHRKPADPARDAKVDGLTQIFDAAVREFGDPGAKWVTSYGHELRGDPALWVRAIEEAADAARAGAAIKSLGGFIRFKHEALSRDGAAEAPAAAPAKPAPSPWNLPFVEVTDFTPKKWLRRPSAC